jgi:large subunit ribosomal protein L17
MRHRISGRTFGRRSGPRKALLRGLIANLILAERITTTVAKAKELRMHIEPLITLAKRGDLHARRQIAGEVYGKVQVQKLFDDLAVRFKDRNGGYTRIMRSNQRLGDGAPMAFIEFLDRPIEKTENKKLAPKRKADAKRADKKSAATKDTKSEPKPSKKTVSKKVVKKSSNSK